LLVDEEGF